MGRASHWNMNYLKSKRKRTFRIVRSRRTRVKNFSPYQNETFAKLHSPGFSFILSRVRAKIALQPLDLSQVDRSNEVQSPPILQLVPSIERWPIRRLSRPKRETGALRALVWIFQIQCKLAMMCVLATMKRDPLNPEAAPIVRL